MLHKFGGKKKSKKQKREENISRFSTSKTRTTATCWSAPAPSGTWCICWGPETRSKMTSPTSLIIFDNPLLSKNSHQSFNVHLTRENKD